MGVSVLRDHQRHQDFIGPRFLVHVAALEMHPLDVEDRIEELRRAHGIGYCNITKCCTAVCPEHITITDNAIIPLKEYSRAKAATSSPGFLVTRRPCRASTDWTTNAEPSTTSASNLNRA